MSSSTESNPLFEKRGPEGEHPTSDIQRHPWVDNVHSNRRAQISGVLLTLFAVGILLLLSFTSFSVLNSAAPILLIAVAYTAFRGGITAGLLSAIITIVYYAFFFSTPAHPLRYTADNFAHLLVLLIISPVMAVMVGSLKQRADRSAAKLLRQTEAHAAELVDAVEQRTRAEERARTLDVEYSHKQLEKALSQSDREARTREKELAAVFEAMTDGVTVYDGNGRLLHMNRAYRTLIGLDSSSKHASLRPVERGEQLTLCDEQGHLLTDEQQPVNRILAGEVLTGDNLMDIAVHTLDGREVQLNVTGTPTYDQDGRVQGGVLIFRDVTERRRLERRTHEALEALLMMAEELVQLPGEKEEGHIHTVVPSTATDVAQRLAELIRSVLACKRVSITTVDPETNALRSAAVVGLPPEQEQQWRARHPDFLLSQRVVDPTLDQRLHANEVLVLDMTQPPLQDRSNLYDIQTLILAPMMVGKSFVGVVALDHGGKKHVYTPDDIALARAVAKFAALVVERERLVQERAEAQANELALREANHRMDEFLGIASHEIRTPLTSIKANIQLVQRQVQRLASDETLSTEALTRRLKPIQDMLERAGRQVDVQNRLVGDLLDVSRIYANKLELRMELCDAVAIVRQTVEDQSHIVAPRSISLHTQVQEALVLADANRIEQVVNNYLSNALKYSDANRSVEVCVEQELSFVRVAVRDEGPGLTPAQQQHIWERFHRVEGIEVKTGSGVGLGLGLHICRTIIERQGGQVGVESTPGKGSTFWFTLPLVDPSGV